MQASLNNQFTVFYKYILQIIIKIYELYKCSLLNYMNLFISLNYLRHAI